MEYRQRPRSPVFGNKFDIMCSTCGCGVGENGATILKPGEFISSGEFHFNHDHHHAPEPSHTKTSERTIFEVEQEILGQNQLLAQRNRGYFEAKKITAINLVSSPGSGKTTLLETTLDDLKAKLDFSVIEGDQQTMNDANRINALQVPVVQINTGKGCHLDSEMVYGAFSKLALKDNSLLIIENVGNLVCPALFDLGENFRVVIISTTEGDDKPLKYPDMFEHSQVCLINKIDLLPYVNFDVERAKDYARRINPDLVFFEVSATTREGMDKWYQWLEENKV
jgi:hydrogenase nickel incorporation protein HypB